MLWRFLGNCWVGLYERDHNRPELRVLAGKLNGKGWEYQLQVVAILKGS